MHTYRHNTARVTSELVSRSGLIEANYTGPLTLAAFDVLRREVLRDTGPAPAVVLRLDKSLSLMARPPLIPDGTYAPNSPSGAVVVRLDQFDMWSAYNRDLVLKTGVRRVVFLDSQLLLAYEWAERQVLASRAKQQQ